MILADTSAWVEYDRATGSDLDRHLTNLISTGGREIAVTEPVLMEVLAGARDERRHNDLRRLLTSFAWIPADIAADFEGAARIYRSCRAAGVTPRGMVDCMIANIALRSGARLLADDEDFGRIAGVVPLAVEETHHI